MMGSIGADPTTKCGRVWSEFNVVASSWRMPFLYLLVLENSIYKVEVPTATALVKIKT